MGCDPANQSYRDTILGSGGSIVSSFDPATMT